MNINPPRLGFAGLILAATTCMLSTAQDIPGWELVWQDEFTQANGTPPDPANWGYNTGTGDNGWGNAEWQYYTSRTNNARIENNQLVIEAHEESYGGQDYTSARLLTQNKWAWTYGRMEARIKVPYGQGIWPAFWMLGADIGSVGWPNCGEIDIMEHIGADPQTVYGTIHGPGYSGGTAFGDSINIGEDVTDNFHVFAVEWEANRIEWFMDGTLYHTATPGNVAGPWVFDHPFFFILNVAVGGQWPGYPDETTVFPQQMLVDYVRVYSSTNTPPPATSDVLLDPGFETGALSPWVGYSLGDANALGGYVESTSSTYYNGGNPGGANVLTHSGQYATKVFGDFTGAENFNGFYQDVTAEPGSVWTAAGWALTHPQDLMVGDNTAWIEVSFRDAADAVLSLYRSQILTSANVTAGSWMNLEVTEELNPTTGAVIDSVVTMPAPAGAAKVRYQVVFRQQPGYDNGAMYFDDLSLVEQITILPFSLSASADGGNIQISFPTQNGVNYQMAYKSSVTNASWAPIGGTIVGDGSTNSISYPASSPAGFYRASTP
jgi:beta-glucanase (GH16 family)